MKEAIFYFLSFKSYVVLPVIILILAMIFRIKITTAIKSSLTIGIGFVGIFMTFDYFVKFINPVIAALIERTGLQLNVLDAGWPPLAAITWSFQLAPLLLVIFLVVNLLLVVLRLTKTVDIDIWNYWHLIFASTLIYQVTHSVTITILVSISIFTVTLKLAEWSAPFVKDFSGMEGVCIPHLSSIVHFPYALLMNRLMDKIPGFNKMEADPKSIQQKFGLMGEPMILGILIGTGLGIGGGYSIKGITELAVNFAAVIYILPKMCDILGSSLIPISDGMKLFIAKKFPNMGTTFIGLDVAIILGAPAVVVTSLLFIPVALILAFILPGINFIPLGDLTYIVAPVAIISVASRGNVIRSFIIGIPMVISSLYIASAMAPLITRTAKDMNYQLADYNGLFTSFLDGGNYFRAWLTELVQLSPIGLAFLPILVFLLIYTWKASKK